LWSETSPGKSARYKKKNASKRTGNVAIEIVYLLTKHEALSLIPSTDKNILKMIDVFYR
jgi:hypothetical protein